MARKRFIKPEFFGDPDLAELRIEARFLYAGLWPWMDRQGVIEADPRVLRAHVFPHDEKITASKVKSWVDELVKHGFVVRFAWRGKELLFCPTFTTHQKLFPDEKSVFNVSEDLLDSLRNDTGVPATFTPSPNPVLSLSIPSTGLDEDKEKEEEEEEGGVGETNAFDFEACYALYPRKLGKKLGMSRLKARIKTRADYDDFLRAVKKYASQCRMERTDPKFIKHFSTFVGSEEAEPWRDFCEPEKPVVQLSPPPEPIPVDIRDSFTDEERARKMAEVRNILGINKLTKEGA